jgi:hypothetical protein
VPEDPSRDRGADGDRSDNESRASSNLAAPGLVQGLGVDPIALVLSAASGRGAAESTAQSGAIPMPFAELWGRLVRRVAWGGDARGATARIEIGAGEWAGATIVVHAVERQVAVEIELPPGARVESWRERLAERFGERGLALSELTIR